eukprot:gene1152-1223_t
MKSEQERSNFARLCAHLKTEKFYIENFSNLTEPFLSQLLHDLQNHYKENYGVNSKRPSLLVIPHSSLFEDFRVDGAVSDILTTLLEGATTRRLIPETIFLGNSDAVLPILFDIEKTLIMRGLFFTPRVFLNKVPVQFVNQLTRIILQHRGIIVSNEEVASHVIDWHEELDESYKPPEKGVYVCKSNLSDSESHFIAHWPRFPDSFNESMRVDERPPNSLIVADPIRKRRYYLSCLFIFDCEFFNEWGNEIDYEVAGSLEEDETLNTLVGSDGAIAPARGRVGRGKKKSISANIQTKILKETFIPQMISGMDKLFSDILPSSASAQHNSESESESKYLDITDWMRPALQYEPSAVECGKKRLFNEIQDNCGSAQPSWFSMDFVSAQEKRYLGYIISGTSLTENSSTLEQSYIQIRNSIVNLYLLNRNQYLTATECRRKISGDISKVLRIHEFLDAFRVINFQVKLESCPKFLREDFYNCTTKRAFIHTNLLSSFPNIYGLKSSSEIGVSWPPELDELLLNSIVSYKMDWKIVSTNLIQGLQRNSYDERMSEFTLPTPQRPDQMNSLSQLRSRTFEEDPTSNSYLLKYWGLSLTQKTSDQLHVLRLVTEGNKMDSVRREINLEDSTAVGLLFQESSHRFELLLEENLRENETRLKSTQADYLKSRLEHLSSKVKLLEKLDSLKQAEIEKFDIEKSDFTSQKSNFQPWPWLNTATSTQNNLSAINISFR